MAQFPYGSQSFSTDLTLQWTGVTRLSKSKKILGDTLVVNAFNDLNATASGLNVIFSAVNGSGISEGYSFIINNIGLNSFVVQNQDLTNITTINSGSIYYFILVDASSSNGTWRVVPWGGGGTAMTAIDIGSAGQTLSVTGGSVVAPGGNVNIDTIAPTSTLQALSSDGLVVFNSLPSDSKSFETVNITDGGTDSNISIGNPSGVGGNITVSVTSNPSFATISLPALQILSNEIKAINPNVGSGILNLIGDSVNINSVLTATASSLTIKTSASINEDLTVDGSIDNPFVAKAWATFSDNGSIAYGDLVGVTSITRGSGIYNVFFETDMGTTSYAAFATVVSGGHAANVSISAKAASNVSVSVTDINGNLVTPDKEVSVVIFST